MPSLDKCQILWHIKATQDVVNTHGGRAGYNEGHFEGNTHELKKALGISDGDQPMDDMQCQALKRNCSEYLGCLFVCSLSQEIQSID